MQDQLKLFSEAQRKQGRRREDGETGYRIANDRLSAQVETAANAQALDATCIPPCRTECREHRGSLAKHAVDNFTIDADRLRGLIDAASVVNVPLASADGHHRAAA